MNTLFSIYAVFLRNQFGYSCKFQPTCSQYSQQAFQQYTTPKALLLSSCRILRCHPFCEGGYDPLPSAKEVSNG